MKPIKLLPFNQTIENKCILISSKNKLGILFVILIFMVMCIEYLFSARVLMKANNVEFTGKGIYDLVSNNSKTNSREWNDKVVNIFKNDTVLLSKGLQNAFSSTKKKSSKKKNVRKNFFIEDLMKQGPFRFLKNYKSPCWKPDYKIAHQPSIRCLPYFYLVGAPKCGTTDMHRRLIQHYDVSKLVVKEPHWIDNRHYYITKTGGSSNLTHYLKIFENAVTEVQSRTDTAGYHHVIFGDCSASTLWDNDYWTKLPQFRNLSEPLYTNADYIHHLNPNTKIIAMLRNPVERLYSEYLYFRHGTPQLFHQGVKNIIRETYDCLKFNTLRHCLYTPQTSNEIRLRIGVYHQHLKEYFRVFPRNQMMVIKLEDFSNNTVSYMENVFSFLDISKLNRTFLQKISDPSQHANKRKAKERKKGEMLPETREMLENFYRPHNYILAKLLGEMFNYN